MGEVGGVCLIVPSAESRKKEDEVLGGGKLD